MTITEQPSASARCLPSDHRLVRLDEGLISRQLFVDPEIYELELDRIFARCWLFLGHESQLPKPNSFFTTSMGEDNVLVTKDSSGSIRAFLNSCRHRGLTLVREDEGVARSFMCSYHGWTFSSDGSLTGVPNFVDGYRRDLDRSCFGLTPVGQIDSYKGLIFATMDPAAEPLREYLGDIAFYLDMILDTSAEGTELIGPAQRWQVRTNWKLPADNFIGDFQHAQTMSHVSGFTAQDGTVTRFPATSGVQLRMGGHGLFTLMPELDPDVPPGTPPPISPATLRWIASSQAGLIERLGELRGSGRLRPVAGTVFPNFSFLFGPVIPSLRIWQPRGPEEIEVWSWCILDKSTPEEVKDSILSSSQFSFGPGGIFEADDVEHWQLCTQSNRGRVTRSGYVSYAMGLGHDYVQPGLPGVASRLISEANARGFYERWNELMTDGTPGPATPGDAR